MDQNHPPANPNELRTLWIGDLHDWMDEEYLSEFLKRNSLNQVVSNLSVIKNVPKRHGFVEFTSRDAAEAALQSLNHNQKPCWWVTSKFRVDWAESFNAGEGRNNPEYTPLPLPLLTPTPLPTPLLTPIPTPIPTPTGPDSEKKSYTICMKAPLRVKTVEEEHHCILTAFLGSSDLAHGAMIQSYKHFNGFTAFIHDSVAKEIKAHPDVKSVTPTVTVRLPDVPMAKYCLSPFGNPDGTPTAYGPQLAGAPLAECFDNNSTYGWSKSFSNKGYVSEGKATSDRN